MRYYANIQNLEPSVVQDIFRISFNYCNKINIYFPDDATSEITALKEAFTSLSGIGEMNPQDDEIRHKEGFSMLIASLSRDTS